VYFSEVTRAHMLGKRENNALPDEGTGEGNEVMRHLNAENLMDYIDGRAPAEASVNVEAHLSQCPDCTELKQELQRFLFSLQEDAQFEPPAEVVAWGVRLFRPLQQPQETSIGRVRKIIASLVYDTFDQPLLAGVRGVGVPPRQLVFRAGDVDVDVKIESMEANDRISLVGQVLATNDRFCENMPVRLESQGTIRYKTITNVVGEFMFDEVPKDTYHLSVDLPEGEITLFCVHRGNS